MTVPLVGRQVPVIEDRYVDIEFGTGCLKVTPAHDKNDYMLGQTHNLETIDIFNEDATVAPCAGMYVGMDRFDVRKQIAVDLTDAGLMEKVEDYVNNVGLSERTKVPIEPRLSLQWFVKMDHFAAQSLAPVMDDIIRFVPEKYKNTYKIWLDNIKDWCISRQLWWGHRIPAWFYNAPGEDERFVVAHNEAEALDLAREQSGNPNLNAADLRRDEGALDTWFSSWLWPITLFDGINNPGNPEINYYYPTATLVTGPDIIFFWVARMIMAGYEYVGKQPFDNVYFTGIVRDSLGRKMSKSLGNSPDPLDLIAKYGADGVRLGLMMSAQAGNDIIYDDKLVENGRNFCNKIWNSFRLLKGWNVDDNAPQPQIAAIAERWFASAMDKAIAEIDDSFTKFRINDAVMTVYRLFRDDFSAWYLEMIKPAYGEPIDGLSYRQAVNFLDSLLRLLHPFMPFITEELWQHLAERTDGESIMYAPMPQTGMPDKQLLDVVGRAQEIVNGVRGVRARRNIPQREAIHLLASGTLEPEAIEIITKLAGVDTIDQNAAHDAAATYFMVGTAEFGIPRSAAEDTGAERIAIEKEIEYLRGFLASVEKKLSNERFVAKAPQAVVDAERQKQADATAKIATLQTRLQALR